MTAFRTRRMQAGDEQEFNNIYNRHYCHPYRKPQRTLECMTWFWHRAPGGPADSWVIEARDSSGWRIVGHHALCPVRFTLGEEDWLCAKTMNSFLLPEYRDQFLYLRFERECLREADARFGATYSVAQGTARLRRALGYENYGHWIQLERGFRPLHLLYRSMAHFAGRYSRRAEFGMLNALAAISAVPIRKAALELVEYTAADAASSSFFTDFWTEARHRAGMAPRRDAADLAWRFWKRPDFKGATLTYTGPEGGRAYFIVDTSTNPMVYSLVDFFMTPANPQQLDHLIEALFVWCSQQGALAVRFVTTAKGLPPELMEVFLRKMKPYALQRFRPQSDLPRRLSPLGKSRTNGVLADWDTTEFLMVC